MNIQPQQSARDQAQDGAFPGEPLNIRPSRKSSVLCPFAPALKIPDLQARHPRLPTMLPGDILILAELQPTMQEFP